MLDFAKCPRDPQLHLAHEDLDVRAAARHMSRLRTTDALREAVLEMTLGPTAPATPSGWERRARACRPTSPDEETLIVDALRACFAVATKPDSPGPSFRRAALLERLLVELLRLRGMAYVKEEVRFRFSDFVSACQDVVGLPDQSIEVFECKTNVQKLEQGQVDELERILQRCDLDGIDLIPAIATLQPSASLADAIDDLELEIPSGFYQCTQESILALRDGPPYSSL